MHRDVHQGVFADQKHRVRALSPSAIHRNVLDWMLETTSEDDMMLYMGRMMGGRVYQEVSVLRRRYTINMFSRTSDVDVKLIIAVLAHTNALALLKWTEHYSGVAGTTLAFLSALMVGNVAVLDHLHSTVVSCPGEERMGCRWHTPWHCATALEGHSIGASARNSR